MIIAVSILSSIKDVVLILAGITALITLTWKIWEKVAEWNVYVPDPVDILQDKSVSVRNWIFSWLPYTRIILLGDTTDRKYKLPKEVLSFWGNVKVDFASKRAGRLGLIHKEPWYIDRFRFCETIEIFLITPRLLLGRHIDRYIAKPVSEWDITETYTVIPAAFAGSVSRKDGMEHYGDKDICPLCFRPSRITIVNGQPTYCSEQTPDDSHSEDEQEDNIETPLEEYLNRRVELAQLRDLELAHRCLIFRDAYYGVKHKIIARAWCRFMEILTTNKWCPHNRAIVRANYLSDRHYVTKTLYDRLERSDNG